MKYILIFLIIIPSFISCATPRPWTKQEKIAAGFFLLAHLADGFTTKELKDNGHYEHNPLLNKYPSDSEVGLYFSLTTLGALTLSHFYANFREPLLYSYGILNFLLATYNYDLNE